ncbi:MAG: sigma-70 family RNA polymerase sigma factor [Pontiellaceae bacterium]|nr:sigma-70 family RNA polymerase sigma factor [Pontiellaceae bacterium]
MTEEGLELEVSEPETLQLETVIDDYQTVLLRYAAGVLNNADAAQDVVQEVFIRLHENWTRLRERGAQLRSWLYRTTHNASVDYIRKESRLRFLHERKSQETAEQQQASARPSHQDELEALVYEHINMLKPREREVLVLRLQDEMSYRQIAEVLDRSEGYVGTLIHTATKKLTQSLRSAGVVP